MNLPKFSQADSSDTRQKGGTGLGLSITKAIVERHGGTISFRSEVGQGSTFYFDLPIRAEDKIQNVEQKFDAETGFYVLICEDDVDNASLLEMMLAQAGYRTDTARTAAEAEAFLARNIYDAMTLDIGLPDKDGFALLEELKANPKTRNLPVIIVSAQSPGSATGHRGGAVGIVDWIKKPIDQDRLAESLRAATGSLAEDVPNILHVEDNVTSSKSSPRSSAAVPQSRPQPPCRPRRIC